MALILVTGSAGFIGFHLCQGLLAQGHHVIGLDGLLDHGDLALKQHRLQILQAHPRYQTLTAMIQTPGLLHDVFAQHRPEVVIHLAAKAGVRQSTLTPRPYFDTNIQGAFELFEAARAFPPQHLLLASTSSVFGANPTLPYHEVDPSDHPMSFYAASKKMMEVMSHSYAHLHGLPITLFRFFTVYGPWGRPDMAVYKFTKAILEGAPIEVYNHGDMRRDFTYVTDLVQAVLGLIGHPPQRLTQGVGVPGDSLSPVAPWRVVNIGGARPVPLMALISAIEAATGHKAQCRYLPMQPGDVPATWADTTLLQQLTGWESTTSLSQGVQDFVTWYLAFTSPPAAPPSAALEASDLKP